MKQFTDLDQISQYAKNTKPLFEVKTISHKRILENDSQEITKSEPVKFFTKLFESREVAHIFHLSSKAYSKHEALGTYYTEVIEKVDELIECYMGQYDQIEGYENIDVSSTKEDPIQYFIGLGEFIKQTRKMAIPEEDTHLHSLIDDILNLIYKTLYKLRFLK